jgi:type II secretory pathway component GspD/PulD (secretin)
VHRLSLSRLFPSLSLFSIRRIAFVLAIFLSLYSLIVHAEYRSKIDVADELATPISIVVSDASIEIFLTALLGNTSLSLAVEGDFLETVSGEYEGSIDSVLQAVSNSHDLKVVVAENFVVVKPLNFAEPAIVSTVTTSPSIESFSVASHDPVVERVFTLKYAFAQDTRSEHAGQSIIPGVASELRRLLEQLGVNDLHPSSQKAQDNMASSTNIMAIPAVNAIVVTDFESRMDLYADLIESIDSAYMVTNRANAPRVENTKLLTPSARGWTVVR